MYSNMPLYYKLDNNRIWSVERAQFVESVDSQYVDYKTAGGFDGVAPDKSGNATVEGLREALVFYDYPLGSLQTSQAAYAAKYQEINNKCQTALEGLTSTYPERELLTFERQEREARALLAGDNSDVAHITVIAQGRGVPVDALARKIVEKADAFALASGALIGQRQKYEDELEALGKEAPVEQIESISVVYTIPAGLM